ncbi:MAG: quinol:electron acceptor oxidoreductase subunit ActD [Steroidobacteraceae bacterium]|jgi:large-conductance mechanosensitive channel
MSKKSHILALFNDFEAAAKAIAALRESGLAGFKMRDVTLKSPIDHPECAAELGDRPVYIQLFSVLGAVLGSSLGFYAMSAAQANFLRQPRGGFPIVPIPPNMVITYELFILTAVFFTIIACYVVFALHAQKNVLYNAAISVDKIGILISTDPVALPGIRDIFTRYHALEISESS